jgi:hypothetical protein
MRNEVFMMCNGTCAKCHVELVPFTGESNSLDVDHIYPQSRGGPDALWNLQPLCARCNRSKGNTSTVDHRPAMVQRKYPKPVCKSDDCDRLALGGGGRCHNHRAKPEAGRDDHRIPAADRNSREGLTGTSRPAPTVYGKASPSTPDAVQRAIGAVVRTAKDNRDVRVEARTEPTKRAKAWQVIKHGKAAKTSSAKEQPQSPATPPIRVRQPKSLLSSVMAEMTGTPPARPPQPGKAETASSPLVPTPVQAGQRFSPLKFGKPIFVSATIGALWTTLWTIVAIATVAPKTLDVFAGIIVVLLFSIPGWLPFFVVLFVRRRRQRGQPAPGHSQTVRG